jgi:hypothetical protein
MDATIFVVGPVPEARAGSDRSKRRCRSISSVRGGIAHAAADALYRADE